VARIPAASLRSDEPLSRGHWSDVREGLGLVLRSRPLLTVLIVWSTAATASAFVNVAEVVLAKDELDAGNVGLGFLVSATGVGLVIGSFFAATALASLGMTFVYGGALALMGVGFGLAAMSSSIVLTAVLAGIATIGNGAAIVYNQVLVQRGAPDAMRGRALAVLMSTYYAVLGLSMAGGGLLVDAAGARVAWAVAGCVYLVAALLAFALTWRARQEAEAPSDQRESPAGLERIRALMTEIEETRRREQQQQRGPADLSVLAPRDSEGRATP
jgi:MFS family permease